MMMITKFKILLMAIALSAAFGAKAGVVADNGQLQVKGACLLNAHGNPIQLRGVSFGWHCMMPRFYNGSAVDRIAADWGAGVVRCSIGLDLDERSFNRQPELGYALVDSIVSAAIRNDIYVIVDFHSHDNNLPLAKEFFSRVSKKYAGIPNLIYEIWNEPKEVKWSEIKSYSKELIPIIRANSPQSVIIVPTPRWDQEVLPAAADPIREYDNLVYSIHFYAATHTEWLRENARKAIAAGLPLFISECAAMVHTGDGVIDTASWDEWMRLADESNLSWVCWSLSDKDETCSMLRPGTASGGWQWRDSDLKPWAVLVKHYLKRTR